MNTVLMVILGIASIVIIVSVLMQQGSGDGAVALGGGSGAAAKKAKGYEAMMAKATMISAVVFVVITIALLVLE